MTTTQAIRTIRTATAGDAAAVAAIVSAAFFDDPVTCWLLPDVDRRQRLAERLFNVYVEPYVANGEIFLNDDRTGAAVWLTPGAELLTPEAEQAFGERIGELVGHDISRFVQLGETFAQYHPEEPLYYCQFLATVPAFQGQGIGSTFLRDMLDRADREGMPAYHEATTPRNRALYERHGYVNQGEISLPDGGPTLWRMWREPR